MSHVHSGVDGLNDKELAALEEWQRVITQGDWARLSDLLTDDVAYHNPAQLEPYRGKDALIGTLQLVFNVFESFGYHRRFHSDEGHVLEFSARIGDSPIFGVDIMRFNDAGKLTELIVMLRPADAVTRLGKEISSRIAAADSAAQS
jgi:hypothetical protein